MRKRKVLFCVLILLVVSIIPIQVFAEVNAQDGLEVSINLEKEEYSKGDKIETTVTVKNINTFAVRNISIESFVPNGYLISADCDINKRVDVLNSGDICVFEISYEPLASEETTDKIVTKKEVESKDIEAKEITTKQVMTEEVTAEEIITEEIITEEVTTKQVTINEILINEEAINETTYVNQNADLEVNASYEGVKENKNDEKIGGETNYVILVAVFILVVIIVSALIGKKKGMKIISFMIIILPIAVSNINISYAEEISKPFFYVAKDIKVNGSKVTFEIKVNYDKEAEEVGLEKPSNSSEEDNYYWTTSKVISVIDANESKNVLNETEAIRFLEGRGFIDYPITYDFSMSGEYLDTIETEDGSVEKHPMYETYYMSNNGEVWRIYVIDGSIFACPLSFIFEAGIEVLYSETNKLTSYGCDGNKFYVTIPYKSEVIVKQVDRIDTDLLNNIECEEILSSEKE